MKSNCFLTNTDSSIRPEERKGAFDLIADDGDTGKRLDCFISSRTTDCSRTRAADLIRDGAIRVNGGSKKPGYRISAGDRIQGDAPPPRHWLYEPEPMLLNILFEDDHIIVVNKPQGMVVHPSVGHRSGTLAQGLLHHCPEILDAGGEGRPGIVHRLDKDTSGTLVAAKTQASREHLSLQFKQRIPEKLYSALVFGRIGPEEGQIRLPVGRHPHDRKKMATTGRRARTAETHWTVLERLGGITHLSLRIKTGRTHQIRVHCKAIHHPIVGDPVYGARGAIEKAGCLPETKRLLKTISRQMLHARRLCIRHPSSSEWMCFESSLPEDMEDLLQRLRKEDRAVLQSGGQSDIAAADPDHQGNKRTVMGICHAENSRPEAGAYPDDFHPDVCSRR